jgi:hypothetical protein
VVGCYLFGVKVAFLWYNAIGCLVVVATGLLISRVERIPARSSP